MKLAFQHKIQAGFLTALVFLVVIGSVACWSTQRSEGTFHSVDHTYQVIYQLRSVLVDLLNTETGLRGYINTGESSFLEPYQTGIASVQKSLAAARQLTLDNPGQQRRLKVLAPLIEKKIAFQSQVLQRGQAGDFAGARQIIATRQEKQMMDEIRRQIDDLQSTEQQLLQMRLQKANATARLTFIVVGFGGATAVILMTLAGFLVRRELYQRERAEDERDRFFTLSLDLLCIASENGHFKRVNPAFTGALGWSAGEMLQRPFIEFVHPDDRAATLAEAQKQVVEGKKVLNFENRYQHKDGSWRILSWKSAPQPGGLMYATARDVTELRQAEEAKRRLAAIVESSDDAIISKSLDGIVTSWNAGAERLFGYAAAEIVGQPMTRLFPPDRMEEESQILDRLKKGGAWINFETVRVAKDGQQLHVSVTISPIRDATGKVISVAKTVRDITVRKQMEEALRRSEENLAVTLHSIGDAVLTTDAAGNVTRMNPIAEKLTGWPQAEALGRPISEVFHILNEQTRQPAQIPVEKVLATGEIHGLANHTVIIARDGTEYPIADSAAPIRARSGRVLGVVLVFRDVTEEKRAERAVAESEHRLRQLNDQLAKLAEERSVALQATGRLAHAALDALTAHVAVLDENGVIITTNKSWQDFAVKNDLPAIHSSEGVNYLDVCSRATGSGAETAAQMAQAIREIIAGRRKDFTLEYDCHSPKEKRWFLCRVTRFASPGPARIVVAHENITQMKLLERQQIRNQRMESLGTLAGGVAHDLNNALSPILIGIQLLKEKYPADSSIVDMFYTSAKRGADMVRQLLTFARGAEGERNAVQLPALIKEMQKVIAGTFPKNIRLDIHHDKHLPVVLGDATQLHQILLNLCVNARDAMPEGGHLVIEAHVREIDDMYAGSVHDARAGAYVVLSVRDTGTGIPPEIIDRIFDPFFTTKAPDKGTGLGLSTVMGIVRSHGGFLQVYSQPGEGSTFKVYLPAGPASGDTEHVAKPAPEFRGNGETILFVDDEAALREIARAVLQRLNFKPLVATDGMDALVQLAEHRAELRAVITDLHMPHMDGLTYVRTLRRMLPDIPVVVSSGRMEEADREEFKNLGVTVQLDKPFTENQLADVLKKVLAPI